MSIMAKRAPVINGAAAIVAARTAIGPFWLIILAIPCGMLMYMAVTAPNDSMRIFYIMFCVAAFITGGFYHCVADMYYTFLGGRPQDYVNILLVTIGNIIGCNIVPGTKVLYDKAREGFPKFRE